MITLIRAHQPIVENVLISARSIFSSMSRPLFLVLLHAMPFCVSGAGRYFGTMKSCPNTSITDWGAVNKLYQAAVYQALNYTNENIDIGNLQAVGTIF